MNIAASPTTNGMYFSKNVPDFVIEQNNAATAVSFTLSAGGNTILNEIYSYDASGKIYITQLSEVINFLLDSTLIQTITWSITEGSTTVSHSFTAIKCEADMPADAASWTAKNFLTRAYRQKRTSIGRNEFLSMVQKPSHSAVTVMYRVVYSLDGVFAEKTDILETISVAASTKITTIETSVAKIMQHAALSASATILQYDIWCQATGLDMEKYTYLLDHSSYRYLLHLLFTNCFGVPETFTATGQVEAPRKNTPVLANINNRLKKVSQNFQIETAVNSGYITELEMLWLDDLVTSYAISIYYQNTIVDAITVTDCDKTDTPVNSLHSFTFKFKREKNNALQFSSAVRGIFDQTFKSEFN